ncbi:decapping nuclease DXO homolog [Panonychus citri]|uniref:decapping nuclease DXO homolog n=1 Tax=Panonychus citri TaxID=50023 RepID=UPI00230734A0|nr:decapping nuclease DXO homolog [Panonychus citri]
MSFRPSRETYFSDKSALRYYSQPRHSRVNLMGGFSNGLKWGRVPHEEMPLLRWVLEASDRESELSSDFICHSRVLRTILSTPCNAEDDWAIVAVKVGRSIILKEVDTDRRKIEKLRQKGSSNAGSYAGFQFISKYTRRFDGTRVPTLTDGHRDSFYLVTQSRINSHSIICANRTDCLEDKSQYEKPLEEMKFVKLATRSHYWNDPRRDAFWHKRAANWWAEGIVSGITTILCGQKTHGNRVGKVIQEDVKCLPHIGHPWEPNTCFNWLDQTLSVIKLKVVEDLVPYRFYYQPDGKPSYSKLDEPVENYVPRWFIERKQPVP